LIASAVNCASDAGYVSPRGNTLDKTMLRDFLKRIEVQYSKAGRIWVMDRGIPTEEVLAETWASATPVHYLVGTPRGRLGQLEQDFLTKPWAEVRPSVQVKLDEQDDELHVLARSGARRDKEQARRRRRLKKLGVKNGTLGTGAQNKWAAKSGWRGFMPSAAAWCRPSCASGRWRRCLAPNRPGRGRVCSPG
jgi:hypothetical protein